MKKYVKLFLPVLCMGMFCFAFAAENPAEENPFDYTAMRYLNDTNFQETISKTKGYFVADFWTDGCKICKEIEEPMLELAEQETYTNAKGEKIALTVGEFKISNKVGLEKWGGKYGFTTFPSLVIFKNGVHVKTIKANYGYKMMQTLKDFLSNSTQK